MLQKARFHELRNVDVSKIVEAKERSHSWQSRHIHLFLIYSDRTNPTFRHLSPTQRKASLKPLCRHGGDIAILFWREVNVACVKDPSIDFYCTISAYIRRKGTRKK